MIYHKATVFHLSTIAFKSDEDKILEEKSCIIDTIISAKYNIYMSSIESKIFDEIHPELEWK